MTALGQSRHFRVSRRRSALAPIADIPLRCRNRRVGPGGDIITRREAAKKAREG
jgi:hypothetical protein